MFPDLGKAKTPYAKSVRSAKKLHGAKPDPGVLFDCESSLSPPKQGAFISRSWLRLVRGTVLEMRRDGDKFRENEAGISSMFLYHASIIIHGKTNPDTAHLVFP